MKSSILALVLAAALSLPALAQQPAPAGPEHDAHHPQTAQAPSVPPTGTPPATPQMTDRQGMPGQSPAMPGGMMGQGGQRPGGMMSGMGPSMMEQCMANCPMMQGGMGRMMGQGSAGSMAMGQPRGDQSVASLALNAINERMHREMAVEYTGNVDADFVRGMIAHHQGAIDMAKIETAFGKDPKIRELAQGIIKAQEGEIEVMKTWLATNVKP